MKSDTPREPTDSLAIQSFSERAKTGTRWIVVNFGLGQIIRLLVNLALAALLYEEAFALMAIVLAVMLALAMFSDIGIRISVVQHARGDDLDFLNTAWTLQVIRGVALFLMTVVVSWPLSRLFGANDPKAYELLFLIPIAGLSALVSGFESTKMMTAARHLKIKEITKIELVSSLLGTPLMLLLAWYTRSVYAIALASVLSSVLQTVLSYWMLEGPRSRFRWHAESITAILSFGKWVFLSTFFTFLATQIDRLAFGGMYPLAEVGVYSIAASLAVIAPSVLGRLQHSVLFPWYSRMLVQGMALPVAFHKSRPATLVASTYLCTLLVVGSASFFELAYDDRYAMGGVLLPILTLGAWFNCLDTMYGSAFLASGRPKWTAFSNASKVVAFLLLLAPAYKYQLGIVAAAFAVAASEALRWVASCWMARRLGLRNIWPELGMLLVFLVVSGAGWWLLQRSGIVSGFSPSWRLAILGVVITLLFAPLIFRYVVPLIQPRWSWRSA